MAVGYAPRLRSGGGLYRHFGPGANNWSPVWRRHCSIPGAAGGSSAAGCPAPPSAPMPFRRSTCSACPSPTRTLHGDRCRRSWDGSLPKPSPSPPKGAPGPVLIDLPKDVTGAVPPQSLLFAVEEEPELLTPESAARTLAGCRASGALRRRRSGYGQCRAAAARLCLQPGCLQGHHPQGDWVPSIPTAPFIRHARHARAPRPPTWRYSSAICWWWWAPVSMIG